MEAFVDTGTYLSYSARPRDRVKAILWPVLVHRVLYPDVQRVNMNLFQKVVMRLIRAGVHYPEDIASLTGLHVNLVKLIQAQLLSRGWVNSGVSELTATGVCTINDEDEQSELLAAGYLFQDALTGRLWPRIDQRLEVIEPKDPAKQFPEFALDRKTGKLLIPFKPHFTLVRHTVPTTQDAMLAWQDYRHDIHAARQLYGAQQVSEEVSLQSFRFQSETPEPAWILVWIRASHNSRLWSIKDPFDIRDEAWWLNESLPKLLESNGNLIRYLGELVGKPESDNQTVSDWLTSLQEEASLQVMRDYPWSQKDRDIEAALAVLLKRREMLKNGQDHANDLDAAITEAQKLLEVLMQWLIKAFPVDEGDLSKSGQYDWKLNENLLSALLLPAFTADIRGTLSRQSLKGVIRSLKNPVSSLKTLVFAAALGALGNDNHPFKSLSNQQLQLNKLLDLANLRNQASHGNSRHTGKEYVEITLEIVLKNIEYTLQFTASFKEWINGEK